jgi:hypothetical protein
MRSPQSQKMRHMSFVLTPVEHEAFRLLCVCFDLKPSEALRAMVRIALGGGYDKDTLDKLSHIDPRGAL